MEPLTLIALVIGSLKVNGKSTMADLHARFTEADTRDIKKYVYKMVNDGRLEKLGANRNRTYKIRKKIE